jgi:hypothetical protein
MYNIYYNQCNLLLHEIVTKLDDNVHVFFNVITSFMDQNLNEQK